MIFSNLAAKLSPEWTARNPEEQRLSMRLWGHWDALRGADALPSRTQFTAAAGADLRQNGFTIEITDGGHEPVFRFVGKEIVDEYGHDLAGRSVNDVPVKSVLGWVAGNLADVLQNKSPIGFEDESDFGDHRINRRGVLLPFSENHHQIDYVVGAISFKKLLAETTFDDPGCSRRSAAIWSSCMTSTRPTSLRCLVMSWPTNMNAPMAATSSPRVCIRCS